MFNPLAQVGSGAGSTGGGGGGVVSRVAFPAMSQLKDLKELALTSQNCYIPLVQVGSGRAVQEVGEAWSAVSPFLP